MKIQINSRKVVALPTKEYQAAARGIIQTLPNNLNLNTGDQIIIKEHDGKVYTGNEIIAEVTESSTKEFRFRKYAVTRNLAQGSRNNRDKNRRTENDSRFNAYI